MILFCGCAVVFCLFCLLRVPLSLVLCCFSMLDGPAFLGWGNDINKRLRENQKVGSATTIELVMGGQGSHTPCRSRIGSRIGSTVQKINMY